MKNSTKNVNISIGEAAGLLGVHIDTLRNWDKKGILLSHRTPGGHRRYSKQEIQTLLGGNMTENIVKNWKNIGVLEAFANEEQGAYAMENQRRFNELNDAPNKKFMRQSIPLVIRTLCQMDFESPLAYEWNGYYLTGIRYDNDKSFTNIEDESEEVAMVAKKIKSFVEAIAGDKTFIFQALSLKKNEIIVYGATK